MQKLLMNFNIAIEAVFANRVRSVLTALGIIFGVAAVIAMLAIGNGAQKEILEQIKLVGVNNIVINPIVEQSEEDLAAGEEESEESKQFSTGLTNLDATAIRKIIPGLERISPEIILDTYIVNNGIRRTAKVVGVEPSYFELFNFQLSDGSMFDDHHLEAGSAVCIIGSSIKSKFFPTQDPWASTSNVGRIGSR